MKNIWLFLKYSFKISKSLILFIIIYALLGSATILLSVYGPKLIIDSITSGDTLQKSLSIGGIFVLLTFVLTVLNKLLANKIELLSLDVSKKYHLLLGDKVLSVEYSYLEDPYYLDLKERALFACQNQNAISRIVSSIASIIKQLFTLIGLLAILSTLGIWLLVIIIACVIINGLIIFASSNFTKKFHQSIIPVNRRFGYYFSLMANITCSKDSRLYNANDLLYGRFNSYQDELSNGFINLFKKMAYSTTAMLIVSSIQNMAIYLYVTYKTISEKLSIGLFSLYVSSAISCSTTISDIIKSLVGLWQVSGYIAPFIELLELDDETSIGKTLLKDEIKEIEFKNVSFKYPKQDTLVLKNISFKINNKEKISIVGLNGAGKTTLIKLICRFYHPTSGEILVNGLNIFEYEINSYNKQIACVFQDFKLINYSIAENITSGNTNDLDFNEIIQEIGLTEKIESLPNGINTFIGKDLSEEAVEVSGGERQKIAIGRAIYKNSSLVILDEPTSALDPVAEADIYENFNQMVGNKTAIYISHRMSSSVFCDKVLVIDNGEVKDFATHKELMLKEETLYYKLFNSQATSYEI